MLMRFDPFRDLDRLTQPSSWARSPVLPMDAYRDGERFVVHLDLPGVDPDAVELTVEKNVLTVSAERRWTRDEQTQVVVSERPQGSFTRQLFLGEGLDPDRIDARYEHGVLTITIPVAEQAKPRKVAISQGSGEAKAIEATASEDAPGDRAA